MWRNWSHFSVYWFAAAALVALDVLSDYSAGFDRWLSWQIIDFHFSLPKALNPSEAPLSPAQVIRTTCRCIQVFELMIFESADAHKWLRSLFGLFHRSQYWSVQWGLSDKSCLCCKEKLQLMTDGELVGWGERPHQGRRCSWSQNSFALICNESLIWHCQQNDTHTHFGSCSFQ